MPHRLPEAPPVSPPAPPAAPLLAALRRLPWWTISFLAHLCVFLLVSQSRGCFSEPARVRTVEVGIFRGEVAPRPPGRRPGPPSPDELAMPAVETLPEGPAFEADLAEPAFRPAAAAVRELADLLAPAPPAEGSAGLLGLRMDRGARAAALRRFGGSGASERAVDRALAWLALHQDRNGRWSRLHYTRHCPAGDPCETGVTQALDVDLDTGITALALLAFLGRGHTHAAAGPYRDTVRRALDYLVRSQAPSGRYGPLNRCTMYNHALAALAVSEAAALAGGDHLKVSVARAIDYLARAQQAGGGWDYTPDKTGRNDTSVTGWAVMALKSAAAAGVEVPWRTVYGAVRHFDRQTDAAGGVAYADRGDGAGRRTTSMVAVGLVSRQFLGWHRSSPALLLQAERLLREPPDWRTMLAGGMHSAYYWYYATLGMFQMGGDYWPRWNARFRDLLVRHQARLGHRAGSWDPAGRWSRVGGRIYFTALNTLDLEIYYRYLPLYRAPGSADLGTQALAEAFAQAGDPDERAAIVRDLGQMRDPKADAVIRRALGDESLAVRFEAGAVLARAGSAAGRQVLAEAARHPSSFIRSRAIEVLAGIGRMWTVPILIDRLTDPEPLLARQAADALERITGKRFPFDPEAPGGERAAAAVAWRGWWRDYRARHPSSGTRRELGTVLATRPGERALVFGLRGEGRVEVGQRVWVYRDRRWVGEVRVVEVLPQMAAGVLLRTAPGEAVRRGDVVSSRPPASADAGRRGAATTSRPS